MIRAGPDLYYGTNSTFSRFLGGPAVGGSVAISPRFIAATQPSFGRVIIIERLGGLATQTIQTLFQPNAAVVDVSDSFLILGVGNFTHVYEYSNVTRFFEFSFITPYVAVADIMCGWMTDHPLLGLRLLMVPLVVLLAMSLLLSSLGYQMCKYWT